ncbi:MAG: hypothetical protein AAB837_00970 [Patescibacteria group bacterium]
MENAGEKLYTTPKGEEIRSTERFTTPEEKSEILKKQQEYDHAYSLWLLGKGPNPNEQKGAASKVIEFPGKRKGYEEKRKAA